MLTPGTLVLYNWNGTQPMWSSISKYNGSLSMKGDVVACDEQDEVFMVVSFMPNGEIRAPAAFVMTPMKLGWMFFWNESMSPYHKSRIQETMECEQ